MEGMEVQMIYKEDFTKSHEKTTLPFNMICHVLLWLLLKFHYQQGTASYVHLLFWGQLI